jgi:hypothetical protein
MTSAELTVLVKNHICRYGESMTYRAVAEALASDDDPRVAEAVRLIREATNDREEFYPISRADGAFFLSRFSRTLALSQRRHVPARR